MLNTGLIIIPTTELEKTLAQMRNFLTATVGKVFHGN